MIRRVSAALAVVAVLLGAAACNGESSADPPSSSDAARTTTEPTKAASTDTSTAAGTTVLPPTSLPPTTLPSTTVTAPTSAPPVTEPPPGSEDWVSVIQFLANAVNSLYAAPDLGRIPEVCAIQSPCEEHLQAQLSDMMSQGARVVDDPPLKVLSAELVPNSYEGPTLPESYVVAVDVVFQVPPDAAGRIVDDAGNTLYVIDYTPSPGETYSSRWTLLRAELSEPWRQSLVEDNIQ